MFVDWDGFGEPQVSYRSEMLYREEAAEQWLRGMPVRPESRVDSCSSRGRPASRRMSMQDDRYMGRPVSRQQQHPPHHREAGRRMSMQDDRYTGRPASRQQHHHHQRPPVPARSPRRIQAPPPRPGSSRAANVQVEYHASTPSRARYISGYDPQSTFRYDYDGHVMHVHRSPTRPSHPARPHTENSTRTSESSAFSAYYAFDAQAYDTQTPVIVVDDVYEAMNDVVEKELPVLPREKKKRKKVTGFMRVVLGRLEGGGWLGPKGKFGRERSG
jgi:hypothetical protein